MDGPKSLDFYLDYFRDQQLLAPPCGERSVSRERSRIGDYLSSLHPSWRALIKEKAGALPPMAQETRLAALIPARHEIHRLPKALSALVRESRDLSKTNPNTIIIQVLSNRMEGEPDDGTGELVNHWSLRNNSNIPLHNINMVWPAGTLSPLAVSRKLLADLTLYRSLMRPAQDGPLYLLSEDADVEEIQHGRSAEYLRRFNANPGLDALRGPQGRSRWAIAQNHLLLLERKSWHLTEVLLSAPCLRPDKWDKANFYWNRIVTGGWNTAFTAEAYAEIGGYTEDVELFEDMDIGQKLSVLRGAWINGRFVPNVNTVGRISRYSFSCAARAALALAEQRHIYDGGNCLKTFLRRSDAACVRNGNPVPALKAIEPFARLHKGTAFRYEQILTDLLMETRRILCHDEAADRIFHKVMSAMGFGAHDYHVLEKGRIKILMFDGFQKRAQKA